MDLTKWLPARTPVRPLVVTAIGGTKVRLAVEQEIRRRGWRSALSPAEANVLIVAGADPAMVPFADAVWQLVPEPKARVGLAGLDDLAEVLAAAEHQLRSPREQHAVPPGHDHMQHAGMESHDHVEHHDREDGAEGHERHSAHHGQAADQPHEHVAHDHGGGHSHGDHHGHDMGGMEMPGGIPMADRAPDRDGLKLDRLTVPLGPVLPAWPAGLLVRVTLQGDVIQDAVVEAVGSARESFWHTTNLAARRLDSCTRLLTVAGWEDAALVAGRLRDDLLAGHDVGRELTRWARRVRRSRTLRWSLAGLGHLGHPGPLAGDTLERLYRWIGDATGETSNSLEDPEQVLDVLPGLLEGTELAGARLIIAGLDPDLERTRVAHG